MGLTLTRKAGQRIFIFEPLGHLIGVIKAEYKSTMKFQFPPSYVIKREETLTEREKEAVRKAGHDV